MRKQFKRLLQICLVIFLLTEIGIVWDGLSDEEQSADYAVVLGNTVHEDGSVSARLKARLDKSFLLFKEKKVDTVIVSGGRGKEGHNEAVVMKDYLVEKGIPSTQVQMDTLGNTTGMTGRNYLASHDSSSSVIIVSQFYHVARCKIVFRRLGIHKVTGAHADFFELRDTYALFREFFAYWKYWVFFR